MAVAGPQTPAVPGLLTVTQSCQCCCLTVAAVLLHDAKHCLCGLQVVAQSGRDSHLRQAIFDTLTTLRAFDVLIKVALQTLSGPRHIRSHLQKAGGIGDDGEMPNGHHLDYEQASSRDSAVCSCISACTTAWHICCTGSALVKVCCGWQLMYAAVISLFKGRLRGL